jgi:hypothetical protein
MGRITKEVLLVGGHSGALCPVLSELGRKDRRVLEIDDDTHDRIQETKTIWLLDIQLAWRLEFEL